ncbi:hypothetical protein WUBG_06265, partial [Wuchereria bancrofti]
FEFKLKISVILVLTCSIRVKVIYLGVSFLKCNLFCEILQKKKIILLLLFVFVVVVVCCCCMCCLLFVVVVCYFCMYCSCCCYFCCFIAHVCKKGKKKNFCNK